MLLYGLVLVASLMSLGRELVMNNKPLKERQGWKRGLPYVFTFILLLLFVGAIIFILLGKGF
jgi:hypothetical protein